MIGKKNIVFGFLYLLLTASLGPYMIVHYFPEVGKAGAEKQQVMSRLAQVKADGFEENLEPMSAEQIARLDAEALLAMSKADNAMAPIEAIKGGPHTHGNLEAVLNIIAGLVLGFIALKPLFKQVISWVFIAGALLHSGMLYLGFLGVGWATTVLNTGIGPVLVLLGFLLIGIAAAVGFRGELIRDS
jgi:hypothetical protein